jgi:hypothetical protein
MVGPAKGDLADVIRWPESSDALTASVDVTEPGAIAFPVCVQRTTGPLNSQAEEAEGLTFLPLPQTLKKASWRKR